MKVKNLLLINIGLLLNFLAHSQMPGWSHLKRFDLTENSGVDITEYQLLITFDSQTLIGNGEMNLDGSDIRFTEECTGGANYNYWIESGINTTTTKVWVKIDTLLANQTRAIYMQYGNAGASAVSAVSGTFVGPHSATDSVSGANSGGVTNSQRGFRFAPNEDILMTDLGKNEPNGSTRTITIFDFTTQAILYQGQTSGPAAQYSYNAMTNPMWLTSGTEYLCEIFQGSSDGYYYGASPQMGQHLTYFDMRYCNGCGANTFPTNSLGGMHYGYVDFWYYTKKTVTPAPTYSLVDMQMFSNLPALVQGCPGESISIDLTVTGGVGPYTYYWTGAGVSSSVTEDITADPAFPVAEYTVEVTDACAQVLYDTVMYHSFSLPAIIITSSNTLICNGESAILTVSGADTYVWDDLSTNDSLTVSPSVTTTYNVNTTSVDGCTDMMSYTQTVNVPATGTQNIAICANESFTYNTHVYSQAGTYTDTIAGVTACDSIVTTVLTVNSLPTETQNISICAGESFTFAGNTYTVSGTYFDTIPGGACDSIITTNLTVANPINTTVQLNGITLSAVAGATSYQWFDCATNQAVNGANSSTFQPTVNGDYGVIVTNGNCEDTSTCVSVSTIGLSELDAAEVISVYPNPNTGKFTVVIQFDGLATVRDGAGKTVAQIELKAGQAQEVQLTDVERGIYFLSAGNTTTKLSITK